MVIVLVSDDGLAGRGENTPACRQTDHQFRLDLQHFVHGPHVACVPIITTQWQQGEEGRGPAWSALAVNHNTYRS